MYWAALSIGLIGGAHCTLMCSPLMAGVFRNGKMAVNYWLYQTGRMLSYMVLGVMIGLLDEGLSFVGLQNTLSILLGLLIIYLYVIPEKWKKKLFINQNLSPYPLIKPFFGKFISQNNWYSRFAMGLLNGLLPCGLVYLAIITATTSTSLIETILFMAIFGLGTLPWIVLPQLAYNKINFNTIGLNLNRLKPILALTLAAFLVLRGLSVQYIHIPLPDMGQQNESIEIPICGG